MKILIVSATPFEVQALGANLQAHFTQLGDFHYQGRNTEVHLLITGVGLPLAAFSMGEMLNQNRFDLAIQAGVGGAYDRSLELGDVVEIISDCFADLGVEEKDGRFTSVHEMGLLPRDEHPFREGRLWNMPEVERAFLPKVHGLSVNKVHGYEPSIAAIKQYYPFAQVESMEGAAFFYACLIHSLHFLQIRAISNYVEARNREAWELELALVNLNTTLIELINTLEKS